ncbi:glycosyl transferase family 2 [Tamlana nanhaiensis]|uniref:Glycosyl transferase family 2 n=1 Tax=Neotamlana nanhaiensis TaxID=1382798 RepID=A0A0D7W3J3_9FLAO|nr:glycosyl transferase family 2 [Tamlana nanhaiensis]
MLDVIFYIFCIVVAIQVIFYFFIFSRLAFFKPQTKAYNNLPVSVIICAKNEAENLKTFLPSIISQDYSTFEIVLINDASSDDTFEVMEQFAETNKNIKLVNVENYETFWGNKKFALTLGIKAAKYEHLLFTDADCKPISNHWISEMASHFVSNKSLVLGYGKYAYKEKSFLNKLIRFETLITAINYFSFAKIGLPYMGVGRNLAYTKTEFFKANGFINHMKLKSGDDDLFVNQVATKSNTSICLTPNSFTQSVPKSTFKAWFRQKRRHVSTAKHYKKLHKALLGFIYITQILFWALSMLLLALLFKWQIVVPLILLRLIGQYIIFGNSAKTLNEKGLTALTPILEIFLIVVQLTIFINNLISKPNYWK